MCSIFNLLANVHQRPSMYVGGDSRKTQLQHLESIIHGYEQALLTHNIDEPGTGFSREFVKYLRETRPDWSLCCGPAAAVIEHSSTEEQAWEQFWALVEEFRRERF